MSHRSGPAPRAQLSVWCLWQIDNGGDVLVVKYVTYGEVIVLEILPSYLGNSWTLSKKV